MNTVVAGLLLAVLGAKPVGISSMEVLPPQAPRVAYSVVFHFDGKISDAEEKKARELIYLMRRLGGSNTPEQSTFLQGGDLELKEKTGTSLRFEQRSGPLAATGDGRTVVTGTGIQGLRSMRIRGPQNVDLSFDWDSDRRYIAHVSEVVQQYLEEQYFEGQAIRLDAHSSDRSGFRREVRLTEHVPLR